MKAISLFACGGIGDLALRHAGFDVVVANELLEDRAEVFKFNYPECQMIIGDILEKSDQIVEATRLALDGDSLDIVFATPPCQGMSKNGRGKLLNLVRQGLKSSVDPRNLLVIPTIEIFKRTGAHTLIMENVPEMENTFIPDPLDNEELIGIVDLVKRSLGQGFRHSVRVVEFANYGVPQSRQRLISIFTNNDLLINTLDATGSLFPMETHSKDGSNGQKWVTVRDTISNFPELDASAVETANFKELDYHRVPLLDEEKYLWVKNTPKEKSAFDNQCINQKCLFDANPTHNAVRDSKGINRSNQETPISCLKCGHVLPRPWVIEDGKYRLMKGFTSAYKRMSWDSPASTLTRNLSYACSDNKLHPSQHRVLSLREAMKLHTVLDYDYFWSRADDKRVSDKLIRELIGESIPPAGLEVIFKHVMNILKGQTAQKTIPSSKQAELLF